MKKIRCSTWGCMNMIPVRWAPLGTSIVECPNCGAKTLYKHSVASYIIGFIETIFTIIVWPFKLILNNIVKGKIIERAKVLSESPKSPPSSAQILSLMCPHCGQKYLIGYDSMVMTNEAAYEEVTKFGATILSDTNPFQGPDLVMYGGDLAVDIREENIKRAAKIRADLKRGVNRLWRCSRCQDGNSIPIPYPA